MVHCLTWRSKNWIHTLSQNTNPTNNITQIFFPFIVDCYYDSSTCHFHLFCLSTRKFFSLLFLSFFLTFFYVWILCRHSSTCATAHWTLPTAAQGGSSLKSNRSNYAKQVWAVPRRGTEETPRVCSSILAFWTTLNLFWVELVLCKFFNFHLGF